MCRGRLEVTMRWVRRLLAAVTILLAANGWTAGIESLVTPGPVAAAHADTEGECSACHAPFSKATQSSLCLNCHKDVAADMQAHRGFHGTGGRLEDRECRSCHTDHKGRDADIVGLVPEAFDHAASGFQLTGRHQTLTCSDCHQPSAAFRDASADCVGCHSNDDPHRGNLGGDCASCHRTTAWKDDTFDHAAVTGYALTGGHAKVACQACHAGQSYRNTPSECRSCHALDDVHKGSRGSDCAGCHTEKGWKDARFDHAAETGFELRGAHARVACAGCHLDAMALAKPRRDCAGCHSADDVHAGQRGADCGACHQQDTWKARFDHLARTGFALGGAHRKLACDGCHKGSLQADLPADCEGCHVKDDPHAGAMVACADCHDAGSWSQDVRFDHEFTSFPLLGMHRLAACEQCHASQAFQEAGRSCADCHGRDDAHAGSLGTDCATCHSPAGWSRWKFDHDRQTQFALTGAHADLACKGCHVPGREKPLEVAAACGACHQADDVHRGQFGARCERCHTTQSFSLPLRMF